MSEGGARAGEGFPPWSAGPLQLSWQRLWRTSSVRVPTTALSWDTWEMGGEGWPYSFVRYVGWGFDDKVLTRCSILLSNFSSWAARLAPSQLKTGHIEVHLRGTQGLYAALGAIVSLVVAENTERALSEINSTLGGTTRGQSHTNEVRSVRPRSHVIRSKPCVMDNDKR